ncbi:MAG: T9SS type A sorting domain-containing protein [Bacteroidia bacterium]
MPRLILIVLLFIVSVAQGQELVTNTIMGGPGLDEVTYIATDKEGHSVTLGTFNDTLYPIYNQKDSIHMPFRGYRQRYIAKHNRAGELIWIKYIDNTSTFIPRAFLVDSQSNIYLAVNFRDSVDVDPSAVENWVVESSRGSVSTSYRDFVFIKFDSAGNYVWNRKIDHTDIHDVKIDPKGQFICTGYFPLTTDMDPSVGYTKATPTDSSKSGDAFVSKLDSSFALIWFKHFVGSNNRGKNILTLSDGSLLASGDVSSTFDADPDTGVVLLYNGRYTVKLDSSGSFLWAKPIGGKLSTDGSGNFYIIHGATLSKYTASGSFIWSKLIGQNSSNSFAQDLVCDSTDVYVVGYVYNAAQFSPKPAGMGAIPYSAAAYFSKFDSTGVIKWVSFLGGPKAGALSVSKDSEGYLNACGYFGDTCTYWNNTQIDSVKGHTKGPGYFYIGDGYSLRIGQCITDTIYDTLSYCDSFYHTGLHEYFDTSGTYYIKNRIPGYCSEVVQVDITIHLATYDTTSIIVCDQFTTFSGLVIDSNSVFNDTLVNNNGCDSVLTINLTVNHSTIDSIQVSQCQQYVSPSGQYIWNKTGIYYDTLSTKNNCDSVIKVELQILQDSQDSISLQVCDSLRSPSTKYLWTTTGTYFDTIVNHLGCDSIIRVDLLIVEDSEDSISLKVCDSLRSPSTKYLWTSTGTYFDTVVNHLGCDSIIRVDLLILEDSEDSISLKVCDSLRSPSSKYLWTTTGTYFDTIANHLGCDSVITIDLNVAYNSSSSISLSSCEPMMSPSQRFLMKQTGFYTDTLINSQSCDSIISISFVRDSLTLVSEPRDTSRKIGKDVSFMITTSSTGSVSYQWQNSIDDVLYVDLINSGQFLGVFTDSLIVSNLILANDSTFYRCLVSTTECYDTSASALLRVTQTDHISELGTGIIVYPNPTRDFITVKTNDLSIMKVSLYNINGSLVKLKMQTVGASIIVKLPQEGGIYLLEITTSDGNVYRKNVIKH